MLERNFTIKQINSKDCFCYVSSKANKNLTHKAYARIVCQDQRVVFLSFGVPAETLTEHELGLSGLYLKALGIKEGDVVTLSEIRQLPEVTSVKVSPLTENDYEILDLVANEVQTNLLSQLKVVANGQNFVAWVGNSISVMLHTEYIFPISPGILDDMTEVVVVKPNPFNESHAKTIMNTLPEQKLPDQHSKKDSYFKNKTISHQEGILEKYLHQKSDLIVRLVPMSSFSELQEIFSDNVFMFSIFIFRKNLPLEWTIDDSSINIIVCALKKIKDNIFDDTVVYFRLCIIDDFIQNCDDIRSLVCDNAFVHHDILRIMKCTVGERVFLKPINHVNLPSVKEIRLKLQNTEVDIKEIFMKKLADVCEKHSVVLNSETTLEFINKVPCKLEFVPSSAKMCVVYPEFLRECKFSVANSGYSIVNEDILPSSPKDNYILNVSNFEDIVEECAIYYIGKIKYKSLRPNILLTGKPGTGKSTLLEVIKKKLLENPYYAYFETVNCKTLKGKTLESLHKVFLGVFSSLVSKQPAVLAIDDLHIICKYVDEGKETATIHYNKISEMLHNMFHFYASNNLITIIATAPSGFTLNRNIYESRGTHLFDRVCEISDLTKNDKGIILEAFLSQYGCSDLNFEQLSLKMEGFVMQDIADLSKKTVFFALKDDQNKQISDNQLTITHNHCMEALKNTVVLSLDNINLHSPGERDFSDIGGLDDVKKLLTENLFWPTKYSKIFDNAPLRLQSGLLLYGPPGTGKTILAGAAAKQCGLRLISVKGPELLSKYIGASEQAVRNIFEKAQSAKPCILFFDEFDSLAPRRGHDNTGVTDRVVNQLLTQLDGVEALSGVCVLAATSRPDLLDPALLRPGRLDRQVKCPLPDKNTRLDILKVLSKTMQLASDVDLDSIASRCAGFSGADLQSVLYTAQLSSVAHLFADNKGFEITDSPEVTQLHLENALKKTRPSLSKNELTKYERIYQMFEGGSVPKLEVGTKATLA